MDEPVNPDHKSDIPEKKLEFKKPILFGRIGKLPKKAKSDMISKPDDDSDQMPPPKTEETSSDRVSSKNSLPPAMLLKELSTPVPYKEPKWSGLSSGYSLEVLKSGMIVENIDLSKQPYYIFGRFANCDVIMAHPTISRHHCILQYKAFAEEGEPAAGWYIYDLDSTHGTFLNKDRLKAKHYTRVRVGHQIKFGSSSRTYVVLGPDYDCEGESDLSVTEIKKRAEEMKKDRDRMIKEAIEQREKDRIEEEKRKEDQGIDWGLGEDAEEETDLAENPFAVTANEELYLEDPKKTLRGYFEREGHELNYDCEERGVGQFLCRVELPMDDSHGRPLVAEVIHKGKKKEAVVACALEACRVLDRAGLLRQAKHESRRRKQRDWSADDYYDSDDDNYLDRTGVVERKRDARRRRHGDNAGEGDSKPLTYDGLQQQISSLEAQISAEERGLRRLREAGQPREEAPADDGDSLDNFMSSLGKQGHSMAQKAEISNTKMRIQKLKGELARTQRLAEIARPAHLPPLIKKDGQPKLSVKQASNSVVYGKRLRLKEDGERRLTVKTQVKKPEEQEFVEEMDSDEEEEEKQSENTKKDDKEEPEHVSKPVLKEEHAKEESSKEAEEKSVEDKRIFGPMRPPENYVVPESYFEQESDRDLPEITEN